MISRIFWGFALLVFTFVAYLWCFSVTKGVNIWFVGFNTDVLKFVVVRAPEEMKLSLWSLFHASNAVHVMFALEMVAIIWWTVVVIPAIFIWVLTKLGSPARLPGSFPPAETVSGHGNAHVKSPPAV